MGASRTLAEQMANAHVEREREAAFVANLDAEAEAAREQNQREAAQAELADHLRRRGAAYLDATGAPTVPPALMEAWSAEHVSTKATEQEAAHQRLVDSTRGQIF